MERIVVLSSDVTIFRDVQSSSKHKFLIEKKYQSHGLTLTQFLIYLITPPSARLRKMKKLFLLVVCAAAENRRVNDQMRITFEPESVADLKFDEEYRINR